MATAQERLKLKRPSCEAWTVREQLCLASSVLKSGDQNWISVSRSLKPLFEKESPKSVDYFSPKSCALQYAQLLENADTPKRKKRETSETIGESIVRRLTQERMAELSQILGTQRDEYHQLKSELNLLKSSNISEDKLQKMWLGIEFEEKEQEQKGKTHTTWLIKRQKQDIQTPPTLGFNIQRKAESAEGHDTLEPATDDEEKKNRGGRSPLLTSLLKSPSPTTQIQSQTSSAQVTSPTIASLLVSSPKIPNPQLTQTVSPQLHQLVSTTIVNATPERPSAGAPTLSMLLELPANLQRATLPNLQPHTSTTATLPQQNIDLQLMQIEPQRSNIQIIEPPIAPGNMSTSEIDHIDEVIPKDIMADVIDKDEINEIIGDIEELIKGEIPDSSQVLDPRTAGVIESLNLPQPQLVPERQEIKKVQETISLTDSPESEVAIEEIDSSSSNIAEIIGTVAAVETKFISQEAKSGDGRKIEGDESKNDKSEETVKGAELMENSEIAEVKNQEQISKGKEEFKENLQEQESVKSLEVKKGGKEEVKRINKEEGKKVNREEVKKMAKEEVKKIAKEEVRKVVMEEVEKMGKDGVRRKNKEEVKKVGKEEVRKTGKEDVKKLAKEAKEEIKKSSKEEVKKVNKEEVKKVTKEELGKTGEEESTLEDTKSTNEEVKRKEEIRKNSREEIKKNPKEEVRKNLREEGKKNSKEETKKNTREEVKKSTKEEGKKSIKEEIKKSNKEDTKKPNREETKKPNREETKKPNREETKKSTEDVKKDLNESGKKDVKDNAKKDSNESLKKDSKDNAKKDSSELLKKVVKDSVKKDSNDRKEDTKSEINTELEDNQDSLDKLLQSSSEKHKSENVKTDKLKEKNKTDIDQLEMSLAKITGDQNTSSIENMSASSSDTVCNEDPEKSQDISLILEDDDLLSSNPTKKKDESAVTETSSDATEIMSSSKEDTILGKEDGEDEREESLKNYQKQSKEADNTKLEDFKREDTKDSSDGTSNTELLENDLKEEEFDELEELQKKPVVVEESLIESEKFPENDTNVKKESGEVKEDNDAREGISVNETIKNEKELKEEKEDKKNVQLDEGVKKEQSNFSENTAELDEEESPLSKMSGGRVMKTYSKRQTIAVDSEPEMEGSGEGADYRAWKKAVMLVYNRLATHKYASAFLRPITEDQAPGYHSIIFKPMDLSTIKKNIDNGTIRSTRHFQRDVMLMFQNAIMYNKHDTFVYKMAITMQEECLQHMQILVQVTGEVSFRRETRTAASSSSEASESGLKKKRSHITPSPHDTESPRGKKRRKSEND